LPQGRLSATTALLAGSCAILAGLDLLAVAGAFLPPLLGVAALVWYLAVYTPLKRRTSLALPLGALCGALSPLIGWSLAGGDPADYRIIILAGLIFIWQIPHFWLLQERHEADYRRAGFPLATVRHGVLGLWIVALAAAALMLPAFGILDRPASLCCAALPVPLLFLAMMRHGRLLFIGMNLFPVMVTLLLFLRNAV